MIRLTRRQGEEFWVNPDHIEKVERPNPAESVVTTRDGLTWIVQETPEEIRAELLAWRVEVAAAALGMSPEGIAAAAARTIAAVTAKADDAGREES